MTDSAIWSADRRTVDAENPWPGLLSFSEADEEFFRGRGRETENLTRLVLRAQLTVLFGLSGLGKSSLLKAGLFPRLRRENVLPVYVRLDFSVPDGDLVSQVKEAITEQASDAGVEAPAARDGETLWEYFHRRGADFWSPRNRPLLPLLVFDQFEEIFTVGHAHHGRAALIETLGDLAAGRPPAELKARLDAHPVEAESFGFGRHHYKLLIALREDYLPDLEGLRDRVAALALNRLRLRRMDGEASLEVVRRGGELVASGVDESVVRLVAKAEADLPLAELQVEPALLSVVCRELNNKRRQRGDVQITADLLQGSEEEILSDFYERGVGDLAPEVRAFVEEELLVEGYRDSVALDKALNAPGVDREAIDQLVDRRLVRIDPRDGLERLELTHDLLTGVIGASRDRRRRWEAARKGLQAREEAERREQEAQRKLKRIQLYSLVLAGAMLVSLGAVYFADQQRRALNEATDRAAEAISALEEEKRLHATELERQKEVEQQLRRLLAVTEQEAEQVQAREEVEARLKAQLRAFEEARRDTEDELKVARSETSKKVTAYEKAVVVDVVLVSSGSSRINAIKVVRHVTGRGLKDSKEIVESAPVTVAKGVSTAEAEKIRKQLEAAGAEVKLEIRAKSVTARTAGT